MINKMIGMRKDCHNHIFVHFCTALRSVPAKTERYERVLLVIYHIYRNYRYTSYIHIYTST